MRLRGRGGVDGAGPTLEPAARLVLAAGAHQQPAQHDVGDSNHDHSKQQQRPAARPRQTEACSIEVQEEQPGESDACLTLDSGFDPAQEQLEIEPEQHAPSGKSERNDGRGKMEDAEHQCDVGPVEVDVPDRDRRSRVRQHDGERRSRYREADKHGRRGQEQEGEAADVGHRNLRSWRATDVSPGRVRATCRGTSHTGGVPRNLQFLRTRMNAQEARRSGFDRQSAGLTEGTRSTSSRCVGASSGTDAARGSRTRLVD